MAAKHVFGMPAAFLRQDQAAFLASLLPLPLPKQVYEAQTTGGIALGATPEEIIDASEVLVPRWSRRIRARYELAIKNQDFSPKSR